MELKFFIVLITTLAGAALAMYYAVSRFAAAFSGKWPVGYGLIAGILIALGGWFSVYLGGDDSLFPAYWLLCLLYVVTGIIHYVMTHNRFFRHKENDRKIPKGEYLFAGAVMLFSLAGCSSLIYFVNGDRGFLFFPLLLSGLMFIIPITFMNMFNAAFSIPDPGYDYWKYPSRPIDAPPERRDERSLVIGFEVTKQKQDLKRTRFRSIAIEDIKLGQMYYHFMEDYNDLHSETPIQFCDADKQPHQWWFRTRPKWYQRSRILNPFADMRDNRIKENTVIICERL